MKGDTAEPCAITSNPPIINSNNISGNKYNFFLFLRKLINSVKNPIPISKNYLILIIHYFKFYYA